VTLQLIHVLAGVVRDDNGNILIAQRPAGKHMAGMWEFPGGKRREGESPESALSRELDEELGLSVTKSRPLIRYTHEYPDRHIDLDVRLVTDFKGQPRGREGQALDWVRPEHLMACGLLPADRPVATALTLPPTCMISGAFDTLDEFGRGIGAALKTGVGLIQIRAPGSSPEVLESLVETARPLCKTRGALLTVNGDPAKVGPIARTQDIAGVHVPAVILATMRSRPDVGLFGASCHDAREIARAESLGADYVFLSPVRSTNSHPNARPMGWKKFNNIAAASKIPVFALGGMSMDDLNAAWHAGAQGVAAITAFWHPSAG
jgi:8-oxo-dGTP diphosphatase